MSNPAPADEHLGARLALALILGSAHGLSFSPLTSGSAQIMFFALTWSLVIGIGPWPAVARARSATLIGAVFGLGHFAVGIGWLYISMHDIGGLPAALAVLAVLLLSAYLAVFGATAFGFAHRVGEGGRRPLRMLVALVAAWVLGEWLRHRLFTGFPWLAIGYAHVDSWLAGLAPWLGVAGVGAAAVTIAAALAQLPASLISRRDARAGGLPVLLLAPVLIGLALLAGQSRFTQDAGQPLRLRLLQGNVPQAMKFDPNRAVRAMNDYIALTAAAPADLVVFPETAFTVPMSSIPPAIMDRLRAAADAAGALVSVGIPAPLDEQEQRRQPRATLTNSVLTIDRQGQVVHRYDKRHLVPFGEFVPSGFRWFVDMMNIPLGDFGRGRMSQPPLLVAGTAVAFNICYEDLFGDELRHQVLDGAGMLINVSNIGWFGRSHALTQHLEHFTDALELGRPMLAPPIPVPPRPSLPTAACWPACPTTRPARWPSSCVAAAGSRLMRAGETGPC
ncbi:MAG: apolipoprotein N-acyltransferase [Burkholderiaceae bacterium]